MADIDLGAKGTAYAIETFLFRRLRTAHCRRCNSYDRIFLQDTDEYANTSESSVMSRLNCPIVNLFVLIP